MPSILPRTSVACALLALAWPAATGAADPAGFAYGSVTRFLAGDTPAPAGPGSYRTDLETASAADAPAVRHVPFGLGKTVARVEPPAPTFANGLAERHYVGASRERIDDIGTHTADITDCLERTITHLDFNRKTDLILPIDRPDRPSAGENRADSGAKATDDGSVFFFTIETRALGAATVEGIPTHGYDSRIAMTVTKPTGERTTSDVHVRAYYAAFDEPSFGCGDVRPDRSPPGDADAMAAIDLALHALHAPRPDARYSIRRTGPIVSGKRFRMWQSVDIAGREPGATHLVVVTERGDVRTPVSDADPIFAVPPGFNEIGQH